LVLVRLWAVRAADPERCELTADDLDDLWHRWLRGFAGTSHGDGWLDTANLADHDLAQRLGDEFPSMAAALCWLAVRPGGHLRERLVAWQPVVTAAFERGLIDPSPQTARLVSTITGRETTPDQIDRQLLTCLEFIDDDLWCQRTADELGLVSLALRAVSPGQAVQLRLSVAGIPEPLTDPRIPRLVVSARRYRRCDGVAIHAADLNWRLALTSGTEAAYRPATGPQAGSLLVSEPVAPGLLEQLAATGGVLADLFSTAQVA
jgi:hypothetical protein